MPEVQHRHSTARWLLEVKVHGWYGYTRMCFSQIAGTPCFCNASQMAANGFLAWPWRVVYGLSGGGPGRAAQDMSWIRAPCATRLCPAMRRR